MSGTPGLRNWLKLAALGIIWGASFMFVALALRGFGPLTIAACRIGLGAAALFAILRLRGLSLPRLSAPGGKRVWLSIIAIGFIGNVLPFTMLGWGQKYVASGFAGVCMAAVPLFILPLAHFLVPDEALTRHRAIGFLTGFAGVVMLIGVGAFASVGGDLESVARIACLGASLCYAIGSIVVRLCPPVDPLVLSAASLISGTAVIVPAALWFEGMPVIPADPLPLVAILCLGIFPTALAQLLVVQVIRSAGPGFMSQVNYQIPVWSVIFGAVLLNEVLPPQLFLSMAMILAGLAISRHGGRAAR